MSSVSESGSKPALHLFLERKNDAEVAPLSFELWPGEVVFVVGANGTGKSALLYKLAREKRANVFLVGAQRQVGIHAGSISLTAAQREEIGENYSELLGGPRHYLSPATQRRYVDISLFDLVHEEMKRSQKITAAVDQGNDLKSLRATESSIKKLNRLLRSAQLPIEVEADGILALRARRDGGLPFDVAALSDGQRAALLLAANVLNATPGTILLIDEPERHLHRSISAPLLRDLFAERPDCTFVVSTHEIDLAADCRDARVLLTRDYQPAYGETSEGWELDWLEPAAGLPDNLRRDVLGARRRVLFVEGTPDSLDRVLYAILFPEVSIVPKGNASGVIAATEALRDGVPHWLDARGLIDRDERSQANVQDLCAKGVHVLSLNAVEALYLHPKIITAIATRQCTVVDGDPNELATEAIGAAVTEIAKQRDRLCARAIEVALRDEAKRKLPTWRQLLDGDLSTITISFAGRLDAERASFDAAVSQTDLLPLLVRYKVRETGATSAVATMLRFPKQSDYQAAVRKLLNENPTERAAMRQLAPTLASEWLDTAADCG